MATTSGDLDKTTDSTSVHAQDTRPQVFRHGSTWVRADFHLHTEADKEFKYAGTSFAGDYVAALKSAGIQVGIITNHNKFDREEFKALRKVARKQDVFLLPGLELSVKDGSNGIHMLVVFSDEWFSNKENTDHIQSFLNVTFAGQSNFQNENGRSNHDLNETIRELDKFGRDYFLVCAHVEAPNGLWGGLSGGRIEELAKLDLFRDRCLGFQKVLTHDKRNQVRQWLGGWYPAEVEGSDCKSVAEVGKGKSTCVKLGAFTFEALKFALLDGANRITSEPPKQRHSYIKKIAFQGDKLDGRVIELSPELNTFIGIRGSGKSTILEAIRYTLGVTFGQNAADREYKEGSTRHALGSGGKITLTAVDRHGREYEVRRIVGEQSDVYIGGNLEPGINIRETVIHKPIYFGQKDLSNTGQGFENDLVERLVEQKLADIRHAIAGKQQSVRELTRRLDQLSSVDEKQKEHEKKKQDAEYRLKIFATHGIEEKLQRQAQFEQDGRTVNALGDFISGFTQELEKFVARYTEDFKTRRKYKSTENPQFFNEVFDIFDRVANGLTEITAVAGAAKTASEDMKKKVKEFEALRDKQKETFAEIQRKVSEELKSAGATAIAPDEFLKLRQVIDQAKQRLEAIGKEKEQLTALQGQLSAELTALNEKWHEEFTIIKEQVDRINKQNTALQIDIEYKGDKGAFLRQLKDAFKGSKLREATLAEVANGFSDGAAIYRELEKAKVLVGGAATTFESYFRQNLDELLTSQVPNAYTIKYHGKQLKNHSLGQRASALILFVLSQRDNDVIVIDQPEDDLDNQTIYDDVIKLICKLKPETQFIFATHNPNIPVLGDAEQVVACDYSSDSIGIKVGSIDAPVIQDAIVTIMEGGKEAFEKRKEIYQIWKRAASTP